ncbi:hypothetical protein FGRMN_10333 [Fusarium graminum]|nr:hypothetical protein FGRMN_10333 [Fusarium graminum]
MVVFQLPHDDKYQLLNRIWRGMPRSDFDTYEGLYDKYFLYLDELASSIQRRSSLYSVHSIDELLSFIFLFRGKTQTKVEVLANASELSQRSADMAASLWLTVRIQHYSGDQSTLHQWPPDESLPSVVKAWFTTSPSNNNRQIPESFSIPNLIRYYGFKITWTSDLLRHLSIDWKYKQITVFEHAICLRNHLEYSDGCPLPKEIIEEAIDTIKLLFPDSKETKVFLSHQDRKFLKIPFGRERSLSLRNYAYWQQDVSLLLDHWEQGPRGWSQIRLRPDRSNFLEYSTFWTATVVLLLTVFSIVFGVASLALAKQALDVSIRSLEVSVRSYDLSLAVACAGANSSDVLSSFCK